MTMYIDNITSEGLVQQKSSSIQVLSTATSASTLTLTAASEFHQFFTGTTAGQVLKLPDATTLVVGYRYQINNDSTQSVAVQDGGAGALFTLPANFRATIVCTGIGTAAGTWSYFIVSKLQPLVGTFLTHKSGLVAGASFLGTPRKATVSFTTPYATTGYSTSIQGTSDARTWTVESITVSGFTINANANQAVAGNVQWIAMLNGEST
jgi:hypothetical protein